MKTTTEELPITKMLIKEICNPDNCDHLLFANRLLPQVRQLEQQRENDLQERIWELKQTLSYVWELKQQLSKARKEERDRIVGILEEEIAKYPEEKPSWENITEYSLWQVKKLWLQEAITSISNQP